MPELPDFRELMPARCSGVGIVASALAERWRAEVADPRARVLFAGTVDNLMSDADNGLGDVVAGFVGNDVANRDDVAGHLAALNRLPPGLKDTLRSALVEAARDGAELWIDQNYTRGNQIASRVTTWYETASGDRHLSIELLYPRAPAAGQP